MTKKLTKKHKKEENGWGDNRRYLVWLVILVFIIFAFYFFNLGAINVKTSSDEKTVKKIENSEGVKALTANAESIVENSDIVSIPVSEISNKVSFRSQKIDGRIVRFMVVKGSDGIVRTAFDACEICGGEKGYRQVGDDVVCNKCGRSFKIDDLGGKNLGIGCWPIPLPHKIEEQNIVIAKSDLERGVRFF